MLVLYGVCGVQVLAEPWVAAWKLQDRVAGEPWLLGWGLEAEARS